MSRPHRAPAPPTAPAGRPPPADRPPEGVAEVTFVGNATLRIRYGALTLLTDPNFLHRGQLAHLGYGLFTRRLRDPAMDADRALHGLDAIVLSHLHGDHWDRVTRARADRGLPVLTTPHAARRLQALHGFSRATGLPTWAGYDLVRDDTRVRLTALPGEHAPRRLRALLPPVMGSLLECGPVGGPVRLRIYLTGDTLYRPALREIADRWPDPNLMVVHLGGTTLPGGFLVTMDGVQGARLVADIRPRQVLPVHYDDYGVMRSGLADFVDALRGRGEEGRLLRCERGATVRIRG